MKKISVLLLSAIVVFSACRKKTDRVFDESYDERINSSLSKYQSVLTSAPYGWKAVITTNHGNGAAYSFYMKFNDGNGVTMVSDFDSASTATPKTSSYRLRQQQQPTLVFDTYSYVHVLADPNEAAVILSDVNLSHGGGFGTGLLSDFEFILTPAGTEGDTLKLTGKANGATLTMTKATEEESNVFLTGQWVLSDTYLKSRLLTYFKRMNFNGVDYDISNDSYNRTITFQYVKNDSNIRYTTGYYNATDGIGLSRPFVIDTVAGTKIDYLKIQSWDAGSKTLTVQIGSQTTTVTETILPVLVDKQAPGTWHHTAEVTGGRWINSDGFHANGVDDGYGLRSFTYNVGGEPYGFYNFYYQLAGNEDVIYPIFINSAFTDGGIYHVSFLRIPQTTANGYVLFKEAANGAPPTYNPFPTSSSNALGATRSAFYDLRGYYFVQINYNLYDMVKVRDGKVWLRWALEE